MEALDGLNPLLIDVVLEVLITHLHPSSILNFRLVCKKWKAKCSYRFRHEFIVHLREISNIKEFEEVLHRSDPFTFQNFHMTRISMNDPTVEKIFELTGETMNHLTLEMTKDDIDICQFRELLLYRAPNLVSLSFDNHDGLPEEVTNHPRLFPAWSTNAVNLCLKKLIVRLSSGKKLNQAFIADLLTRASTLEELYFGKPSDRNSETFKILQPLQAAPCLLTLTTLKFGKLEDACIEKLIVLSRFGLRLKRFSFESLAPDCTSNIFEEFLSSQQDELVELTLNEYLGPRHMYIAIPVMRKLKILSFSAFETPHIVPIKPIKYLETFPALEKLAVYGWQNVINWDKYFSEDINLEPHLNVTHLQPPYRLNDVKLFRKLYAIFPRVTALDITSPSNAVLQDIWNMYTGLRTLEVFLDWNNVNIDAILTGANPVDCETARRTKSYENLVNFKPHQVSIRDLKGLSTFVCEIYEPWRDGEPEPEDPTCLMTDASVYAAFFHMPHLQNLYIARSDISAGCVLKLAHQLPLYAFIDIRGSQRQNLREESGMLSEV